MNVSSLFFIKLINFPEIWQIDRKTPAGRVKPAFLSDAPHEAADFRTGCRGFSDIAVKGSVRK